MNPEAARSARIYVGEETHSIRNPQSAIRNSIAAGLMLTIAFTALALGTVEAWSVAIFELIVLVLLFLWGAKSIVDRRIEISFPAAALPLGAFVLLALVQGIALSRGSRTPKSLSMDVEATRGALVVIFFLFVCFLIVSNFFTTVHHLQSLANFLIIFGLVLAVFALIQHFTWEGRLFWFRPMQTAGAGTGGPFVNRNHFAGYMEMLIPIPVALALSRAVRGEARAIYAFAAAIMGIAEMASLSRGGVVSFVAALLFIATISTRIKQRAAARGSSSEDRGSKIEDLGLKVEDRGLKVEDRGLKVEDRGSRIEDGGSKIIGQRSSARSSTVHPRSSIIHPLSSIIHPRSSTVHPRSSIIHPRSSIFDPRTSALYPAALVLSIAVAIGAGVFWVGADSGLAERLATDQGDPSATARQMIWRDTLAMIRAHPLLGVGVGAYQTVFPMYGHSDGSTIVEFAHNDYLQALADGGIIAGALAVWFIIVVFRAFARGTRSRDPFNAALALGAGAGVFAILVHSLFDFNLQLPSNALLFLVLAAMVVKTGAKGEERRAKG